MLKRWQYKAWIFCFVLLAASPVAAAQDDPSILFLTWTDDPLHSMTVVWLQPKENVERDVLFFRDAAGREDDWTAGFSERTLLPDHKTARHVARLKGLHPGHSYQFRFEPSGPLHRFRTAPADDKNGVQFAVGGDVYYYKKHTNLCHQMNVAVAAKSPLFVVLGGDLAYSTDKLGIFGDRASRWYDWLEMWTRDMVTPEGYMIPLVPIIGNHDTLGRYGQTADQAPYYFALFPFPGKPGYGSLEFGDYLSVTALDSGHVNSVGDMQREWLEEHLRETRWITHRFAVYHVAAYPSTPKRSQKHVKALMEQWVPLFDEYELAAAFEHHEHTYKRSYPLRRGKVSPRGTLYLGGGTWGVVPRTPARAEDLWYLEKTGSINHAFMVKVSDTERVYEAIDMQGNTFDQVSQILKSHAAPSLDRIFDP